MGLLDDLKQEAERLRRQKETEEARQARLEAAYQREVKPSMEAIARYLFEMTEQLKVLELKVPVCYDFPGIGRLKGLLQDGYRIIMDSNESPRHIRLQFQCARAEEEQFLVQPESLARETRELLQSQRIRFAEWPQRDGQHRVTGLFFQARLRVWVNIVFEALHETSRIQLSTYNFDGFNADRFNFGPQAITDEWLDQLGHFLLRKSRQLGMLDISDEAREQIRAKIQDEQSRRERELAEALERERLEEEERKSQDLFERLRKTLFKPVF